MSTFDESSHPRTSAGVKAGGQFTTKPKAEADVVLPAANDPAALRARFVATYERIAAQQAAGVTPRGAAELRLAAVASAVRLRYPQAVRFNLAVSDQPGSTAMWVAGVYDADGTDLTQTGYADFGDDEDDVNEALGDMQDFVFSDRRGYASFEIDDVLSAPEPVAARGQVGSQVLASFRSLHGDLDADEVGTARDLLTELHHWARVNGHDLSALVAAAGEVADEEADA